MFENEIVKKLTEETKNGNLVWEDGGSQWCTSYNGKIFEISGNYGLFESEHNLYIANAHSLFNLIRRKNYEKKELKKRELREELRESLGIEKEVKTPINVWKIAFFITLLLLILSVFPWKTLLIFLVLALVVTISYILTKIT